MDLKDLKSTWDHYSDLEIQRHQMESSELRTMLHKRTLTLIDRLRRNSWTGFIGLSLLCILMVADDFILSPSLDQEINIPVWIKLLDITSILLFMGTFLYFFNRYRKTTRNFSQTHNLLQVVTDLTSILSHYRKLFHSTLGIFMTVIGINYLSGLYTGLKMAAHTRGVSIEQLSHLQLFVQLIMAIIFLFCISMVILFGFKWAFRRLYGRYQNKLTQIKKELTELTKPA